jgi:hypothetical protein
MHEGDDGDGDDGGEGMRDWGLLRVAPTHDVNGIRLRDC